MVYIHKQSTFPGAKTTQKKKRLLIQAAEVTTHIPTERSLSFCLQWKFSKSHHICCVSIELQDKWITGHLVWQTAAALKAGGDLRTEPERNATAEIHFQLRRRGTKQSSSPLYSFFNLFSVWMFTVVCPLVSEADNRLRKISLSTFKHSGRQRSLINKDK